MLQIKIEGHPVQRCRASQLHCMAATPTVAASYPSCSPTFHSAHRASSLNSSGPCIRHSTRRVPVTRALSAERGSDVVGFGNLCVDVVLPVEQLPPPDPRLRRQLLDTLTGAPPDKSSWEVGGNCNFMVAAARLGLQVASVGHIGTDVYGEFMDEALQTEGIRTTTRIAPLTSTSTSPSPSPAHQHQHQHQPHATNGSNSSSNTSSSTSGRGPGPLDSTLICFVLVDPAASGHAFCSRYDFGPWPLLEGIRALPAEATTILRSARAVFTNGFIFDELPLAAVQEACSDAIQHGAAIFFDPGPRCQTMLEGSRRAALDLLLDLSSVVLMTEEEASVVTGLEDPQAAAQAVLARPGGRAQWVVVKMGGQGALLCERCGSSTSSSSSSRGSISKDASSGSFGNGAEAGKATTTTMATRVTRLGAVKVEVVDTVGCGDSFAAAVVMGFISGWCADVTLALANAVGAATATGSGAGRNVARLERVLELLAQGAGAGGAREPGGIGGEEGAQREAYARARKLLLQSLNSRRSGGQGQGREEVCWPQEQLSTAA